MRIAYIGQKGIPMTQGGVEAHVENLAIQMVKKGHDVYVYTRSYYTDKNLKEYKGIKLISIRTIKSKNFDAIIHTFLSTIHALFQNYDIIHYHAVGPSLLSFIPRIFSRAKIVGTFHCKDRFHKKWGFFAKFMLKLGEYAVITFPHKTIFVSPDLKNDYKKGEFIPNGFEIKKDYNTNEIEKLNIIPKKYFLVVSRLIAHKGIQYAIEAFKKLNNNNYQLIIVGDTFHDEKYSDKIKNLANDNPNIILTGNQTGNTLNQLFTNAFCFLIPSEGEGLSITLLEAMGHGIPTIASNIEGNRIFIDKNLVYSFEDKNYLDLYKKINYLISHYEEATKKADETKQYIIKNFSWEIVSDKIEKLYKSL
ncbi:MAG: glycosyltransferase family 4 protein [Patescibacteria group bacterium]|nr:glycosyltransferase family 4 protein [Patescibacteria group bacterium]MDD4304869.1 glycosyltransferase family 4 protein [Patescibacteria group bacterium]MDD4695775.1 glycosyltransferase family 4 protein [Patescibacteria group bacterium]